MKTSRLVFWEVVLIIGSILLFRGVWVLMDLSKLFDTSISSLVLSSILGLVIVVVSLYMLRRSEFVLKLK